MKLHGRAGIGAFAAAMLATTACATDQNELVGPEQQVFSGAPVQYVDVYKHGPAGVYDFSATATGGNLVWSSFTVAAGSFRQIWNQNDPLAADVDITVTEDVPVGMKVDSIKIYRHSGGAILERIVLTGTNSATVENVNAFTGAYFQFFNSYDDTPPPPPPGGGEGCTPGYWKQSHHFDSWVGYAPSDLFSSVYEDAFPGMTLLQVVSQGGGGLKALGRHTVAALLNASGTVDYAYDVQGVIDAFNGVYPGGDYEGLKGDFEYENELGCPLN